MRWEEIWNGYVRWGEVGYGNGSRDQMELGDVVGWISSRRPTPGTMGKEEPLLGELECSPRGLFEPCGPGAYRG